jgi:uncharacterized membrane protein (Fun14 family)
MNDSDHDDRHDDARSAQPASRRGRLADQVARVPPWNRRLLWLALLLVAVGVAGQVVARVGSRATAETTETTAAPDAPHAVRAFGTSDRSADESTAATPADQPWWARLSPAMTKVGVSFIVGFLVGWVFRAFLKGMLLLTLVVVGGLFALSYFGVLNIDFTAARESYDSAMQWLTAQGTRLKDVVMAHLPSSGGGAVGAFLGLRRK